MVKRTQLRLYENILTNLTADPHFLTSYSTSHFTNTRCDVRGILINSTDSCFQGTVSNVVAHFLKVYVKMLFLILENANYCFNDLLNPKTPI